MAKIQIKRGQQSNVQSLVLAPGELAVALDSGNVYIGTDNGKVHINPTGGTADEAVKLKTSRVFSVTGDATAPAVNFDGTGNVELILSLPTVSGLTAGTYAGITVDSKGRVTGARALNATDIPQLTSSKISNLGTAATKNTGTGSGNIPVLGTDGKLDSAVIPSIALSDIFTVTSEAEMLALTAETGDVAIRTDVNKTFILAASPATTKTNWKEILTPAAPVQSVNGKTGIVTLNAQDVGATDEKVKMTAVNPAEETGTKAYLIPFTEDSSTHTGDLKIGRLRLIGGTDQLVPYLEISGGGAFKGSLIGTASRASSADCLNNDAKIGLSGAVTGTPTEFDGSEDITIPVTAVDPTKLSASVPVAKGGTGATTAAAALTNFGLSATAAELNYCDGVTSNIQDQLDAIRTQDIDGGTF